jgi:hypothetical protein
MLAVKEKSSSLAFFWLTVYTVKALESLAMVHAPLLSILGIAVPVCLRPSLGV